MGVVHGHDPWSQCPACQQLWLEGEQWLWQMLPLLPFQVWMPNSSLLVGEEGKKAHATTAIWQVREQGPAGPPRLYALPSLNDFQDINTFSSLDGLKRQKERRCTAHSSHLCSSLGRGEQDKEVPMYISLCPHGKPGARLFVAWSGCCPFRHLLLHGRALGVMKEGAGITAHAQEILKRHSF